MFEIIENKEVYYNGVLLDYPISQAEFLINLAYHRIDIAEQYEYNAWLDNRTHSNDLYLEYKGTVKLASWDAIKPKL